MTDFDLRLLVREVCETVDSADPRQLVKEVSGRIAHEDRDTALEQALHVVLLQAVARDRHHISPGAQGQSGAPAPSAAGGSPSRKVASIRDAWRQMLRDRISVGPDPSEWKFLADCTAVDLDYAASIREEHARRTAARAAQYRQLAELVTQHGVSTVGQLPSSVLGEHLNGDDA